MTSPRKMHRAGPQRAAPLTYSRAAARSSSSAPTTPTLFYASTSTRGLGDIEPARRIEAFYLLGGGLVGATTILLAHQGHRDAAAAVGVAGAITGAIVGALRLILG